MGGARVVLLGMYVHIDELSDWTRLSFREVISRRAGLSESRI